MELSPYVFDGDDVMQSQVKVWDYFSRYVPAIPRKHQPSNPAASILPNPQLDEEAAKAVVENMRDQEHKAAAAQAKALRAEAAEAAGKSIRAIESVGAYPELFRSDESEKLGVSRFVIDVRDAQLGTSNRICQPPQLLQGWTIAAYSWFKRQQFGGN
jgi:hypothetical protein